MLNFLTPLIYKKHGNTRRTINIILYFCSHIYKWCLLLLASVHDAKGDAGCVFLAASLNMQKTSGQIQKKGCFKKLRLYPMNLYG